MIKQAGVSSALISATSAAALDTGFPHDWNIFIRDSDITVGEVVRKAASDLNAYAFPDGAGVWRFGRFKAAKIPVALSDKRKGAPLVRPESVSQLPTAAPVWEVRVGGRRNYCKHEPSQISQALIEALADITEITTLIDDIGADNILSRVEKQDIIRLWSDVEAEQPVIAAQATALGITTELTAYNGEKDDLGSYLGSLSPAWNDTSADTPITRTALNAAWKNYNLARETLRTKIAAVASTKATWSGITDTPTFLLDGRIPLAIDANGYIANGKVLGAAIAAAALDDTKFAAGYEPVRKVTALPSASGYTGPAIVFNSTDGKLYRYASGAWTAAVPSGDISGALTDSQIASIAAAKLTGQITSTQITDDAITTPKIATGAVTANEIAAGTITGDKIAANEISATKLKLLPSVGPAINPDPNYADPDLWVATGIWGSKPLSQRTSEYIYGYSPLNAQASCITGQYWYFQSGKKYRVSIEFYTGVSNYVGVADQNGNHQWWGIVAVSPGSAWTKYSFEFTGDSAYHRFIILLNNGASGQGHFRNFKIEEKVEADLIIDGTITGDKIVANGITAGHIAAGQISGSHIQGSTVTGDKIAGNTITAGNLATSNLITASAQISDLIVTNAKIADLTIGTEKFYPAAILRVSTTETSSDVSLPGHGTTTFWTVLSLSVTKDVSNSIMEMQGQFQIYILISQGISGYVRLYRGGTLLREFEYIDPAYNSNVHLVTIPFQDLEYGVGAGTYTYSVQVSNGSNVTGVSRAGAILRVMEIKAQ